MAEQSIFDHKNISSALKEAFDKIKHTDLHINMAILGRESPYIIRSSVKSRFYANGMSIESADSFFVIPYTSILYAEVAAIENFDQSLLK